MAREANILKYTIFKEEGIDKNIETVYTAWREDSHIKSVHYACSTLCS